MNNQKIILLSLLPATCVAGDITATNPGLRDVLRQLEVGVEPGELPAAPIPGFLEVTRGVQVLYVSTDGRLLIDGDVLSLKTQTNLTERSRAAIRRELIASIPRELRIVAPAEGAARGQIVVFVDTNCPYCRILHERRADFTRRGVEIHFILFPRSGPSSDSYTQAVAVWCAADRLAALESALSGTVLPPAECDNPVERHYALAKALHLKGTPALVTEDGGIRYGVVDVNEMLHRGHRADR
jgi:thiol:disulfide interchange protein DsbC